MELYYLIILTITLSVSGAFSPGPLTFSAIIEGSKGSWFSGFKEAFGHLLFELPFVFLLALFLQQIKSLLNDIIIKYFLSFILISFIIYFSLIAIKDGYNRIKDNGSLINQNFSNNSKISNRPIITGFVLTASNPLFLSWWATVGLILILSATTLGFIYGLSIMYASHVWMDFFWLGTMGIIGKSGKKLLNNKQFGVFLILMAFIMFYFGIMASLQLINFK
ncbi:LysE family transporter [Caldisphaera lagunensis]|uniref:LysE family transporter n=1 Tax=Caldisphaera lagunensis TaxID=200415 RepID=UPI0006626DC3|nr:LysE family transporter [Caldisphaera lagunensis]